MKARKKSAVAVVVTDPLWVREMHCYFRTNGYYRADDLRRVLGDPARSVKGEASTDFAHLNRKA